LLTALGGTAVLAIGFGLAGDRIAASTQAAPQLRSVPAGMLELEGIRLTAGTQPPYCAAEQVPIVRGWIGAGRAGCAISRGEAEGAALQGVGGTVSETVLARVSGDGAGDIGYDRLAWVTVVHSTMLVLPAAVCEPPVASGPACAVRRLGPVSNQAVVVVDASTGAVLATLPVIGLSAPGAGGPGWPPAPRGT
jgi:hypothetical protein